MQIIWKVNIQRRGAVHRSLEKGTSSRRAQEQSTTASPFPLIKSWSSLETHCCPAGLEITVKENQIQTKLEGKSSDIRRRKNGKEIFIWTKFCFEIPT